MVNFGSRIYNSTKPTWVMSAGFPAEKGTQSTEEAPSRMKQNKTENLRRLDQLSQKEMNGSFLGPYHS